MNSDNCIEITLSGMRCKQTRVFNSMRCYYHDKIATGLTGNADLLTIIEDDDDE